MQQVCRSHVYALDSRCHENNTTKRPSDVKAVMFTEEHMALQVKKAGKDAWVSLSDALPQIRKEAAGDFSMSFDHAKEPVRVTPVPGDDQPGRGRGKGTERGGGRAARPARRPQRDVDDLLPVMPEVLHLHKQFILPSTGILYAIKDN